MIAGAPSFDEFCKNRDKYLGKDDEKLGEVERGSTSLSGRVKKHRYEIEGFKCNSLEEVERVAKNQGIPIKELDYRPELIPLGGGKCDVLVKFVPKHTRDQRGQW